MYKLSDLQRKMLRADINIDTTIALGACVLYVKDLIKDEGHKATIEQRYGKCTIEELNLIEE